MARKYDLISALSEDTTKRISKNREEWTSYLTTAARLYKYPFQEQVLIYAQRPDASACASIEVWNDTMHCWVNRGAKGIALIDENSYTGLKYVFDVSDVHKARRIGRDPNLWVLKEEHQETVIRQLEKTYGVTAQGGSFEEHLIAIANQIAEDSYAELVSDMKYVKEGSFLEEFDEQNVEIRVRETLASSIAYTLLSRCGADTESYLEELNFDYIHDFSTLETLSVIGGATTDLSKSVLMEIGKTIKAYDREMAAHERESEPENSLQKELANGTDIDYNTLKRESEKQPEPISDRQKEGEKEHESDIRKERRLSDTTVENGQTAGGRIREVRENESRLPERTQERDLRRNAPEGETKEPPAHDSGTGRGENGLAHQPDAESRGSERKAESRKSDALGTEDEQHPAFSRGNRADGTDLQLNTEETQPDRENLSGLSLSELEHGILQFDDFMKHKRREVAGYLAIEPDADKQTEYVKNSYKHKEYAEFYVGKERAGYYGEEDGLTIWAGNYLSRSNEAKVPWEDVKDRILYYMEQGSYLLPGEEPERIETEPQFEQLSLFPSIEEQAGNLAAAEAGVKHITPAAFTVPEERIDATLRTGGGRDNSRKRIFAKYQQGKTPEEMTEFLKKEYQTTGKGFTFDGQPVSAWFDESGMKLGYGTSAKEQPLLSMDWAEIEKRVRAMVEQGTYMSSAEAFLVDESERSRIANHVYFFFRDGMGELPEELSLKAANFPDSHAALINMLSTTEGIDTIAGCMDKAFEQLESGEKKLHFRSVMPTKELREELENLKADYKEFPLSDQLEVLQEDFITQDEIDARIGAGSGIEHGKFRIYEYFMEGHSPKENADFLKNEYGTGGSTHALIGSDHSYDSHDFKGIKLEKGNIGNPYASVLLSWNVVEKRIRELVRSDRYLTTQGKEAYVQYKQEQAEQALKREQERLEHGVRKECKEAIENIIAEKFDGMRLPKDIAEEIIRKYGQERVEYVLARSIMQFTNDGRFSRENKDWAKELVPYADWNTNDLVVTSHPAVLDGFTYLARKYREIAKEQEVEAEKTVPETDKPDHIAEEVKAEEPKAEKSKTDKIEQIEHLKEMETAMLLCEACGLKDVAGWSKETDSLTLTDTDRVLEEKAACDYLLTEAVDKVLQSVMSGDMAQVAEVDRIIHLFQPFASRYQEEPEEKKEKQIAELEQKPETEQESNEDSSRFRVEQTSDAFEEPFTIWDGVNEEYYDADGIIQTFTDENEAEQYLLKISDEPLQDKMPEPAKQREKPPQIDKSGVVNYRILPDTPDTSGEGKGFSPKEKFRQNVEAIRTLEKIEGERRIATQEEQKILAGYVGWGGLSDAFDETKANWSGEYQELKALLSPEEYDSARESTLNAHYTSPAIIRNIYAAIGQMGFEKGNILEPSMGIGNFFGMLPEQMKDSRLYGVELDGITGRIAKQLYPHANIKVTGFEKAYYPNDFFDVAVGNVPFGQYKVADRAYDKNNFLIHDYFFAKTLDKVRPGGIVAFVTSKGTMDKQNPAVRKYLAHRAELLGAVRLPNTAFKENAGTEVTSDILFLKKRDRVIDLEPNWVHLSENEAGIAMNDYFVQHPEMILGSMEMVSGPYGMDSTCKPDLSMPLSEQLRRAVSRIEGSIEEPEFDERSEEAENQSIPADPNVKNYSYTVVEDKVYYRENSMMKPVSLSDNMEQRVKGMVGIRECTQELIAFQLEEYPESMIKNKQTELNQLYDDFSKKYGLINSRTNKRAFSEDSSYCLLCSLEKLDDEGKFQGKADMFSKRTIKKQEIVTSVDTASEALAVSLSEKAKVDVPFMAELAGKSEEEITKELTGIIFQNPVTEKWENADEYLSGNVREKLQIARTFAENHPEYTVNVSSLEQVQPKELDASEIEVRLGATWIDPKYIEDFMRDTFETPEYLFDRKLVGIQYSGVTGQWNVKGKNADHGNSLVNMTFGTGRANAYKILEDSLNLRDTRIFDTKEEDGKEKRVLNKKETMLASQKQEAIREAFKDWVFQEPGRRETLCRKYNELFNSTRPREYDGSHLQFPGMTPDIILKPHQKNAVAHVLYGDNTLLAHCVGAGKTFEMTAAAMESKRLGLCQKSLFVVPNHLTEQWASDFLRLYPGANILAATKKDFEPANRKKFCSRIATGDYDAVIIGHSQFEKIPLSKERQIAIVERQIDEIEMAIEAAKAEKGERYTVKQMEKTKKSLSARLERLNDDSRKDDVVTFEQLGVDRLFVDESHNYKNLFLYTKMRNVAGIAQTEAQKSSDMFAKCQYLDELTGGKGVTFATGTPISNSMTELYTNMRYLQYNTLQRLGLGNFDSWAATFGETQTAIELAPEGTGYRAKTRFAKFFNLPELIALFKESADIQTPDMLKLPVPEAEYINEVLKPSDYQKDIVSSLAERAERVRDRLVEPNIDNMLKITNDGRKLALDQRLINDMLPDEEHSKSAMCVKNALQIWEETKEQKSAQLIFCDLSTPKGDGTFNVYEDIRSKLIGKGVPENEIAFIHEANTETRKAELFAKVRSGQVRFLLGSTQKMGAGTNVQDRLIALHHLDVPWRPSDIEQQEGRILRQGNLNEKVKIFRYVTEGTFDSYSWQLIENKQKFIGQIMTSKSPVRSCEDIDEAALTYAEVKALATGNPYIKEKMDLDIQVSKLKLLKANHTSQKYRLEDNIAKHYPQQITAMKERIAGYQADIQTYQQNKPLDKDSFSMKIGNKVYTDKKEAGTAFIAMCREAKQPGRAVAIGEYQGFQMSVSFDSFFSKFTVSLKGQLSHEVEVGADTLGNIQRLNNALESMKQKAADVEQKLINVEHQLDTAKTEVTKPFSQEQELNEKLERLSELNALLNMDEKGDSAAAMEDDEPGSEKTDIEQESERENPLQSQEPESVAEAGNPTGQAAVIYPIENARHNSAAEKDNLDKPGIHAVMTGRENGRISVKEKLAQMRIKAQMGKPEIAGQNKNKEKVESL